MKRIVFAKSVVLIAMALLLFTGCGNDGGGANGIDEPKVPEREYGVMHETSDYYDVVYQYKPGTIVLSESEAEKYIIKVDVGDVVYFSNATPLSFMPEVGSVITTGVSDVTPYGLGVKVVSVSNDGSGIKCVTEPAALDEIFDDLTMSAKIPLIDPDIKGVVDSHGNFCEADVVPFEEEMEGSKSRVSFGSPSVLAFSLSSEPDNGAIGLFASGTMYFGSVFNIEFDLKTGKHLLSVDFYSGISGEIGVKMGAELPRWIIREFNKILQTTITVGPVVLRPYVDLAFAMEANIEGSIAINFEKRFKHTFGMEDGIGFQSANSFPRFDNVIHEVEIDATGTISPLIVEMGLGVGLYTTNVAVEMECAGAIDMSADFRLENPNLFKNTSNLGFDLNAKADVEFKIELFKRELVHKQAELAVLNIFHYEWPLFPQLVDNSFSVKNIGSDKPSYDLKYSVEGGLLSKFFDFFPGVSVYESVTDTKVYSNRKSQSLSPNTESKQSFNFDEAENGKKYKGCPSIYAFGRWYDHDGIIFPGIVGRWKYTDREHEYYVIERFDADGSYRYDEYDLSTGRHVEYGTGTYTYDWVTGELVMNVTAGQDAPFEDRATCQIDGDTMKMRLHDEKMSTHIYHRLNESD